MPTSAPTPQRTVSNTHIMYFLPDKSAWAHTYFFVFLTLPTPDNRKLILVANSSCSYNWTVSISLNNFFRSILYYADFSGDNNSKQSFLLWASCASYEISVETDDIREVWLNLLLLLNDIVNVWYLYISKSIYCTCFLWKWTELGRHILVDQERSEKLRVFFRQYYCRFLTRKRAKQSHAIIPLKHMYLSKVNAVHSSLVKFYYVFNVKDSIV